MLLRNKVAIVVVGAGIAVASVYTTLTGDAFVARMLREGLAKAVRAPCSFRRARFTFLAGLEVEGLSVLDPERPLGPPLLEAEHAHVDYVLSLFGTGPRVTRVEIDSPKLRLTRGADGTVSALDVFKPPPTEGP